MRKLILILFLLSSNAFAQYSGNNGIVNSFYNVYDLAPRIFSITEYGAVNDSTINSTSAIQRTIDSADRYNGIVLFPPGNYTSAALTLPDSTIIEGRGAKLNFLIGQAGNLLTLDDNCEIYGLTLDGGAYSYDSLTAEGNRTGINLSGDTKCSFAFISVKGFSEKGIEAATSDYCILTNSLFKDNYYSLWLTSGAEYWDVASSIFQDGKYGAVVAGGNNQFLNCTFEGAVYGAWVAQGSNEAHGGFTGCEFTHNTSANLYVTGITLPEMFVNCAFYSGRVWLINSVAVGMIGCQFGTVDIIVDNSTGMIVFSYTADTGSSTVTFTELNAATFLVNFVFDMAQQLVSWND